MLRKNTQWLRWGVCVFKADAAVLLWCFPAQRWTSDVCPSWRWERGFHRWGSLWQMHCVDWAQQDAAALSHRVLHTVEFFSLVHLFIHLFYGCIFAFYFWISIYLYMHPVVYWHWVKGWYVWCVSLVLVLQCNNRLRSCRWHAYDDFSLFPSIWFSSSF